MTPPAAQTEYNERHDPTPASVPKCADCQIDTVPEEVTARNLGILLNFKPRRAERHRCPKCGKTWLMVVL